MFIALTNIIVSFLVTSLLIVPFINFLYKISFFKKKSAITSQNKNAAVTHLKSKSQTPEGGGILLILVTIFLFPALFAVLHLLGKDIFSNYPVYQEIFVIFFTFISFGLLGLYDDVIKFYELDRDRGYAGLRSSRKLILQALLSLAISSYLYFSMGLNFVYVPFIGTLFLGPFFIAFSALTIMTFCNAVNFTDGVDGLSMGILLISLIGFLIITSKIIDTPLSTIIGIWIGGIIAFLYFNVYPARVFLGDVGALSFGATLAVVALLSGRVLAIFVFGLIFFIEFLSSAIQLSSKKFLGRSLLPVAPAHYYFLKKGWHEAQLTQRAWVATIMLTILGLFLSFL